METNIEERLERIESEISATQNILKMLNNESFNENENDRKTLIRIYERYLKRLQISQQRILNTKLKVYGFTTI
jgi:superfamily II RNA helicase